MTNTDLLCYVSLACVEEFKIESNKEGEKTFAFKTFIFRGRERLKKKKTIFKIQKTRRVSERE